MKKKNENVTFSNALISSNELRVFKNLTCEYLCNTYGEFYNTDWIEEKAMKLYNDDLPTSIPKQNIL